MYRHHDLQLIAVYNTMLLGGSITAMVLLNRFVSPVLHYSEAKNVVLGNVLVGGFVGAITLAR